MKLLLLLVVFIGCNQQTLQPAVVTLTGKTMGTTYSVKLAGLSPNVHAKAIQAEIDKLLETINDQMSTYRPNSELSRFNKQKETNWFEVSAETVTVVTEAIRISELSGGAFDVTVGPLVNLWHFGPDKSSTEVPSDDAIETTKKKVGYRNIEVRRDPPALKKIRSDVSIDLSAIAKGFAVDKIAEYLDTLNTAGYLVEIGGEMRSHGTKNDGEIWMVGIESPVEDKQAVQKIIPLHNRSLATSGDYRNYFEQDGKRFSHTIDPRTGRPITHGLAAVSVVADNCMHADALATACMVLGPKEGYDLAIEQDVEALFIIRDEDGFIEKITPAFKKLINPKRTTP